MDEELKLSPEFLFKELIEEVSEYAVLLCDRHGKIIFSNRGAELILGYNRNELLGKPACDIFTPEDLAMHVPEEERKKAIKNGFAPDDRWHLRGDGSRFWGSGITKPLKNTNGDIIGFTKIFRNLNLRKQTEDNLKSQNAELARFAHTAAHDLQEPLRNIDAFTQLFEMQQNQDLTPEMQELLKKIRSSAKTMHTLIRDILSYSEMKSSKDFFERTELNTVFDSAVAALRTTIKESSTQITRGVLPELRVIPTQIERLFINLFGNAIKFRSDLPPRIYVHAERSGNQWIFSVRDNGIGIEMENLAIIFEEFKRLHLKSEFEGSGLGLALCKKIVEMHGGKIWVESEKGKGSTFFFTLRYE